MHLGVGRVVSSTLFTFVLLALLVTPSSASLGDHLPDFKECVKVLSLSGLERPLPLYTANNHRSVKPKTARMAIRYYVCLPSTYHGCSTGSPRSDLATLSSSTPPPVVLDLPS
jgi:hypothetical protein